MRVRFGIAAVAALSSLLVGGTALASYRAAMGPLECCKSHCKHEAPSANDVARCCTVQLGNLCSGAAKNPQALAAPAPALVAVAPWTSGVPDRQRPTASSAVQRRPAPDHSLVAQHTSLLR